MKYYAIKRPDGSWVMKSCGRTKQLAWDEADDWEDDRLMDIEQDEWQDRARSAGYRCCEVSGFVEVGK